MTTTCPHCQSRSGFVFGTCCQCGWNQITHRFDWIRVYVDQLALGPNGDALIGLHAHRTRVWVTSEEPKKAAQS